MVKSEFIFALIRINIRYKEFNFRVWIWLYNYKRFPSYLAVHYLMIRKLFRAFWTCCSKESTRYALRYYIKATSRAEVWIALLAYGPRNMAILELGGVKSLHNLSNRFYCWIICCIVIYRILITLVASMSNRISIVKSG